MEEAQWRRCDGCGMSCVDLAGGTSGRGRSLARRDRNLAETCR